MLKKKIVIGITAPLSIMLLEGQLNYFSKAGYEVYLMAPNSDAVSQFCAEEQAIHLPVDIFRDISVFKDIKALFQIIKYLRKIKPDIVNAGTPKMSLLGILGAYLTGVKKRIYTCRGFRYEHEKGMKRRILKFMEKLTSRLAHSVICISPSVKELGLADQIFPENKVFVLGKGSSNGINLNRFNRTKIDTEAKEVLIRELGVKNKFIFGFVGRIIDRKGINELYAAFDQLFHRYPNIHLIIVGGINIEQVKNPSLIEKMNLHKGITLTRFQRNVPLYLSLLNVFVLPAWWEGFGNTLIQAAAMRIPIISTNVTGCKDAVSDGFNGILVQEKSAEELEIAMEFLFKNKKERQRMGKNGITWSRNFDSKLIWKELQSFYEN